MGLYGNGFSSFGRKQSQVRDCRGLTGDGFQDLALPIKGDNSISLFQRNGDGTFTEFPGSPFKRTNNDRDFRKNRSRRGGQFEISGTGSTRQ